MMAVMSVVGFYLILCGCCMERLSSLSAAISMKKGVRIRICMGLTSQMKGGYFQKPFHTHSIIQNGLGLAEICCLESHQEEECIWAVLHFGVEVGRRDTRWSWSPHHLCRQPRGIVQSDGPVVLVDGISQQAAVKPVSLPTNTQQPHLSLWTLSGME